MRVESPSISKTYVKLDVGQSVTLGLKGNTQKISWASSNKNIATVSTKGVVKAVGQGSVKITAKVNTASYTCVVDTVKVPGTYTKGEWIKALLKQINVSLIGKSEYIDYYFSDTKAHPHGVAIELAYACGIIPDNTDPQDVPVFKPNDTVTREFAAVAMVRALKYTLKDDMYLSCTDQSSLKYPKEDYVAIKTKLLALKNNAFAPDDAFTKAENDEAIKKIKEIQSEVAQIVPKEVVDYNSSVVKVAADKITDYTITELADGYKVVLPQSGEAKKITTGSSFVLPITSKHPTQRALIARSINVSPDGNIEIIAGNPANLAQVVESIDYAGVATAMPEKRTVIKGVTCTYSKTGKVAKGTEAYQLQSEEVYPAYAVIGGSVSMPGKLHYDLGKGIKIGEKAKIKGSFDLEIPNITAKVDVDCSWSGIKINEAIVSISEKAKATAKLEYTVAQSETCPGYSGAKEIGRVPFRIGTTGLSLDLVIYVFYDAKGSVSVVYTVDSTQGIQYKDNTFRDLGSFDSSLDLLNLEGSAKTGLQFGVNIVAFEIWDLIGVDAQVGPGVTASVKNHVTENLVCVDGTVYLYMKVELNDDTVLGDVVKNNLHYDLSKIIYNENNSPLKLKVHFENLKKVPECTYGKGKITGYVYDARSKKAISGARVVLNFNGIQKTTVYSDSSGKYTIDKLSPGSYELIVSATDYSTYSVIQEVKKNTTAYVESALMLLREETNPGQVNGRLIDGVTGYGLEDVTLKVRKGWGQTSGTPLQTLTASGSYNFWIAPGNYTIEASVSDYITDRVNVTVTAGDIITKDITLVPKGVKNMRIVLTWGSTPRDLDSHFFGPNTAGGGSFHTYFHNKNYYYGNNNIVNLDLDDISSYGPETTTLKQINKSGTYSFYVHDYTNRTLTSSRSLSSSGAKVVVYINGKLSGTFHVPANKGGTVWHVFDYNASSKQIIPRNRMYYRSAAADVRAASAAGQEETIGMDEQMMTQEEKSLVDYYLWYIHNVPEKEPSQGKDSGQVPELIQEVVMEEPILE